MVFRSLDENSPRVYQRTDRMEWRDLLGFKARAVLQTCFEFASMGRRSRHVASMARVEEGVRNVPMTVMDGETNGRIILEENV